MNELGYSTETTEPATPAADASGKPEHSDAGQAAGHNRTLNVRAAEDRLPLRQDVNDAAWDNPQWDDEADLDDEYDGDLDAILAADLLPPRQDVNDATPDDGADWEQADLDNEDDLYDKHDSDPDATIADENDPAPADAHDVPAEPASPPDETAGTNAQDTGSDNQDASIMADSEPDQPGTGPATAEQDLAPKTGTTTEEGTGTQAAAPERPEAPGTEASESLSPEAERVKTLEAELSEAKQRITELEARSGEQPVLSDRARQQPADTDRHPGDASTPEHGADEPGTPREQDAVLAGREGTREPADERNTQRTSWKHAVIGETIGMTAALVDAVDVAKAIAAHAPADMLLPVAATALGLVATGKAIIEKRKEKKE